MKHILYLLIITCCFFNKSVAQERFFTNSGFLSFFSHSPLEDIKADNHQVLSIIDTKSNELVIYALMKSFMFKKALMQEHFNENYVESDKFPKAVFKGKIVDFDATKNDTQQVDITGSLNLHGRTSKVQTKADLTIKDQKIQLKGGFNVLVADYGIPIPRTVANNIAKEIKISFDLNHEPYTP